jgi:SAM-dependent methyltransferase
VSGRGSTEPPQERSAGFAGAGAGIDLGERYEEHHRERRAEGDFVFVPERIPFFRDAIGRGRRVLDLGCRSGAFTRNFLAGNEVVGLDIDRVALAKAAELGVETVVANVDEPLPFPAASFDAVVAGELLEHLQFPDALVAEARRVLRPGGVLVGSVPNAFRLQSRLRFLRGRPPEDDPTHLHLFSPAAMRKLLAGFEEVRIEFVGGRYRRLSPRLLARDLVFSGARP